MPAEPPVTTQQHLSSICTPKGYGILALADTLLSARVLASGGMRVDKVTLVVRDDAEVPVRIHHPPEPKHDGVVILVPGQGYHKNMPILRRSAEALQMSGTMSVRFDWAYVRAGGSPSSTLDDEVDDLGHIVGHLESIGHTRVMLVGKSLGCIVAARLASEHDVAALVWLTPPLHPRNDGSRAFPGSEALARVKAPLFMIAGDRDPLCHLDKLAAFVASCPPSARLVVVPGDHRLEGGTATEADASLATLIRWLNVWSSEVFSAR
jgi:predicted alpha/beta-hydrolase family hydrolase